MAKTSRSREHYRNHQDWHSQDYVSKWAEGQDPKEKERQEQFRLLAKTVPYDKQLPIKILDVGAGYGALTQFLLKRFPNATAVCQDGSEEMAKLGRERMEHFKGSYACVVCDFLKSGWSQLYEGLLEAIV